MSGIRIGLLDSDSGFARVLAKRLEAAGGELVPIAANLRAEQLVALRLHALVVDPRVLGPDPWAELGVISVRLPALALVVCTAPVPLAERVRGLRLGADDWMAKPCHPEEVLARVQAILRRRRPPTRDDEPLVAGELEVRPDLFQAFARGVSADLTRREFELLTLLAGAEGQVLPREEIYERVWGYAMAHGDRSVDVFVRKLRAKLDRCSPGWRYIHTHFGIGYRFAAEPVAASAEPELAAAAPPSAA